MPFDVASSRTIFYSLDLSGARKASAEIHRQAMASKEVDAKIENPISVAIDLNFLSESKNPTDTALSRIESELTKLRTFIESSLRDATFDRIKSTSRIGEVESDRERSDLRAGWTDERVETLKNMWLSGASAVDIAGALGGLSRNAVIGKIHRLGLHNKGTREG